MHATNRLIELQEKGGQTVHHNAAQQAKNMPVDNAVVKQAPKLAQALTWLMAYPDMQGLSLRKAAEQAGVTPATLQRAIAERRTSADAGRQNRLF